MMTEIKCCKPFSRGTTLLLVWSALMSFVLFSITMNLFPLLSLINRDFNDYAYLPVLVLLLVTGWIGDTLLGRYRDTGKGVDNTSLHSDTEKNKTHRQLHSTLEEPMIGALS